MSRYCSLLLAVVCLAVWLAGTDVCAADEPDESRVVAIQVEPAVLTLRGPDANAGLLVHGKLASGRVIDLTHRATFLSDARQIADVSPSAVVSAASDGQTRVAVTFQDLTGELEVRVADTNAARTWNFEQDIVPVLSRYGCNSSGCHGKAEGQNGFKLSVFGFDPAADYAALVKEGRGRRVALATPDRSLLLSKASGGTPHGGGIRINRDSVAFRTLDGWVRAGAPFGSDDAPTVKRIRIAPDQRVLHAGEQQQLRVIATDTDGREVDVTSMSRFQSNHDGLAQVDETGLVQTGQSYGQVAVMASYMGAVATFDAMIPRAESIDEWPKLKQINFIDELVQARLRKLNIVPSDVASDSEFLRRTYLDLIGTLPTADETRRFLADEQPEKRTQLVDQLLQRPEYADLQALKWSDLLRVDREKLGHKSAYAYYRWIHRSFAGNLPINEFARELVTARGPLTRAPAGHFYQVADSPKEMAGTISQVLLGVRIACAECHHHPYDRWSQRDHFGMRDFFAQVQKKNGPRGTLLVTKANATTQHPRTQDVVHAYALGTEMPTESMEGDRRQVLADWLTSPDNTWFARNIANRTWARLMGRGLVEPVDDFRDTNPPSNPELLNALAQHLVQHNYDLHELIRTITASRTYQQSSLPNATNRTDETSYSRALLKRMDAEVLMDAVSQVTGVREKFRNVPAGTRAIQLWDSQAEHYFLKLFGRPTRKTACECERMTEPGISQVMHMLNSPETQRRLSHEAGQVATLERKFKDDGRLIEELYLICYSRFPKPEETQVAVEYFSDPVRPRREAAEDLAWGVLNSIEFLFNH